MARPKTDELDKQIERAWYRLASGVQVNIMDIPKIFRAVRDTVATGVDLDVAVQAAIQVYRAN